MKVLADVPCNRCLGLCWLYFVLLLLLWCIWPSEAHSLSAFDCSDMESRSSAFNALSIQKCKGAVNEDVVIDNLEGQVIQTKLVEELPIVTCSVKTSTTIKRCGIFSHNYAVENGFFQALLNISRVDCYNLVKHGFLPFGGLTLRNLSLNSINFATVITHGSITPEGSCSGTHFTLNGIKYRHSVASVVLEIFASSQSALIDLKENIITLSDMEVCNLDFDNCLSLSFGYVFWALDFQGTCNKVGIDVLYSGNLSRISSKTNNVSSSLISINEGNFLLNLETTHLIRFCGSRALVTKQERILVVLKDSILGFRFNNTGAVMMENLDLTMYFDNKVQSLKRNFEDNLRALFLDVSVRECEFRRKSLLHRLRVLKREKVVFRNILTDQAGFATFIAGNVLYISKCKVVAVSVRNTDVCSINLPVKFQGRDVYLDPMDGTITDESREVPCTTMMPLIFFVNNRWISKSPKYLEAPRPQEIVPDMKYFKFHFINNFLHKGIYSPESIQNYSKFLSHGSNKRKALESIVNHFGRSSNSVTPSLQNFFEHLNTRSDFGFFRANNNLMVLGSYFGLILGVIYIVHLLSLFLRSLYNTRVIFGSLSLGNWLAALNPAKAIFKVLHVQRPDEH